MSLDQRTPSTSAHNAIGHQHPRLARQAEPASHSTPDFYVHHWDHDAARGRAAQGVLNARMFAVYVSLLALATTFAVLALYQGERRSDAVRDAMLSERRNTALAQRVETLESMNQGLVEMVAQLYPGDAADLFARLDALEDRAPLNIDAGVKRSPNPALNKIASMPVLPTRHAGLQDEDERPLTRFEPASGEPTSGEPANVEATNDEPANDAPVSGGEPAAVQTEQAAPEQTAAEQAVPQQAARERLASLEFMEQPAPEQTASMDVASAPAAAIEPAQAAPAQDAPRAVSEQPQASANQTNPDQANPGPANPGIVLRATEETWIQILDGNGAALFTKLMKADDVHAVAPEAAMLITGNPTGLAISVDGVAAPALNEKGPRRREIALDAQRLMAGTAELPRKHRVNAEAKAAQ